MLFVQNISIYMHFGGEGGGRRGSLIHFLFIIQKNRKSTKHDLYLNQILHHFDLNFFPRMNNKKFTKMGPQGAPLLFLYEVSIVVLIHFIAILLTPGIFLIQIVKGNKAHTSVKICIFVLFTFYWTQLSKNSSPKFHECTLNIFVAVPGWGEVIVRLAVGDSCSLCSANTCYSVDLCGSASTV